MESHDKQVLDVIAPFCEAGFALHWLHPRQKRPIGNDWQKRPVFSLEELQRSHRPGNNLGLRLGEPSHTASGYVHVFDADIRIAELADEAWAALRALLPSVDLDSLPCVASGSGGESRHLYFVTDKPFSSKLLLTSEAKHRREVADPDTGVIKEKWSYDWEIELFGTGKQVAMPPSIHPDTGKPYIWEREFDLALLGLGLGPHIPSEVIEAIGAAETTTFAFEAREPLDFKPGQLERELDLINVSELHYDDWIRLGQALHHQFGGSQEGYDLWVEHTKRSAKFTGDSQLREMKRTKWRSFGKYRGQPVTMATIRQWAQAARIAELRDAFDEEPDEEGDALDDDIEALIGGKPPEKGDALDDDIDSIGTEVANGLDWVSLLEINPDTAAIKATLHNVTLIVRNDPRLVGLPQINEFTQETVQRITPGRKSPRRKNAAKPTPQLEGRVWDVEDRLNGDLWSDDRDFAIRSILEAPKTQGGYGVKVSDRDLKAAVTLSANDHPFHPVREYLDRVEQEWDGIERLERLFIIYLGAPDNPYTRSVARLMMTAAVARVFEPGHKFDFAVILEGLQGKRKSTFIQILGRSWFAELDGDFHDPKSMIELMQGAWIMEIPELSGFSRGDVRTIKAFISRQRDRARLAYARRAGSFPRQCIFIGSTNDKEYLKDDTGGRRFWPMECFISGEIDTARLEKNIDQLWAEAVRSYRTLREKQPTGTLPLYLRDPAAREIAARLQESRRVETANDGLAGRIWTWLDRPINDGGFDDEDENGQPLYRTETCLMEIFCEVLGGDARNYDNAKAQQLGIAMQKIADWVPTGKTKTFKNPYGRQRSYLRKR